MAVAERVVNPPKQAVSVFADTQSSEIKDRIFDEFNSLSIVYQKVTFNCFKFCTIKTSFFILCFFRLDFTVVVKFTHQIIKLISNTCNRSYDMLEQHAKGNKGPLKTCRSTSLINYCMFETAAIIYVHG